MSFYESINVYNDIFISFNAPAPLIPLNHFRDINYKISDELDNE